MALDDIFQINGTSAQQALIRQGFAKLHFPWEALQPALAGQKIVVEFADLSQYGALFTTEDGQRIHQATLVSEDGDEDGEHTHILWADMTAGLPEEGRHFVAGLAWHGKLQIEQKLQSEPNTAIVVLSSEIAHEVDFFYLEPKHLHGPLLDLLFGSSNHPVDWWHGSYSDLYWQQPGESWMAGFGLAYLDGAAEDHRFTYTFKANQVAPIRQILALDNTPPPPPPPVDPPALPREMIRLMNAERAKSGLAAVTDMTAPTPPQAISWIALEGRIQRLEAHLEELPRAAMAALIEYTGGTKAAQAFADEMKRTGNFSHTGEGNTSPGDRLVKAGVTNVTTWGENIANGFGTAEQIVQAWMNSAGHRANILNPAFTHVGTGFTAPFAVADFFALPGGPPPPPPPPPLNTPQITALTPTTGPAGTPVVATGVGFGTAPLVVVTIQGQFGLLPYRLGPGQVTETSDTRVAFRMPTNVATGPVFVRNTQQNSLSNLVTWTLATTPPPGPTLPPVPTGLSAMPLSENAVKLTWTDPSQGQTSFDIERAMGDGSFATVINVSRGTTRFQDTGLLASTLYRYQVRAKNDAGRSGPSNVATVTTMPKPPPPPPPPQNGAYQLALAVKLTQQGAEWVWTSDVTTTATPGLDLADVKPCLTRQGIVALQKYLESLA